MATDKVIKKSIINILSYIKKKLDNINREDFEIMLMQYYLFMKNSILVQRENEQGLKVFFVKSLKALKSKWAILNLKHKPDLIIWITENNQLAQVLPVSLLIKKKGIRILYLSYKRILLQEAAKEGFECLLITLPSHKLVHKEDIKKFEITIREVLNQSAAKEKENNINALLKSYELNAVYTKRLKSNIQFLLKKLKPKTLLVGNDLTLEGRAFTYLSNKNNIETLMIQHGAIHSVEELFSQHLVKKFMVFGEESKKVLIDSECTSEIIITGAPYIDKLENVIKNRNNDETLNVLIGFSGPGHLTSVEHHKKSIGVVINLVKKFPAINFYFKLHPKDKFSYYSEVIENTDYPNVFFSLPDNPSKNIFDWLGYCDLLITSQSTVAIEAMLHKLPVICLDLLGDYKDITYVQQNAVKYVNSYEELEKLFSWIRGNDFSVFNEVVMNANVYLNRFYGPLDGKSAERCAQIIGQTIIK